jgi:hypothetical protein
MPKLITGDDVPRPNLDLESSMSRIMLVLACLSALSPLAGCASPTKRTFACSPDVSQHVAPTGETPAHKDAAGDYTCD